MEKVFKLFFFPCEHFWNFKLTTVHFFPEFLFVNYTKVWWLARSVVSFHFYSKVWWWARSVVPFRFVSNGFDLSPFFVAWNFHAPLKQSTFNMKKIITLPLMVNLIFITEFIEYVAQGSLLKPNDLSNLSEYILL